MANKRLHVHYSGSVQGVGFRFTAERIAGSLGLRGWAKNLRDGRVEILCEGRESDLKAFLQKIDRAFDSYIRDSNIEWDEATGEYSDFNIRF